MGYDVFALLLGVAVIGLLWERHTLTKELTRTKAIAALLIAEKMGLKVDGKNVSVELESIEEKEA